jgi:Na+/proline symporter
MHYLSIDYLIVYAFLFITLAIGLWVGRGVKDMREYVLANKSFGTVALTLTYLATDIGGAAVLDCGVALAYSEGIIYAIANSGLFINYMIMAFVIAPRMVRFKGCMTLGDVMKSMYGTESGVLVGIINFLTLVCFTGMELAVLGVICSSILGVKASWGIILGGILFSAYTAHGGMRSVTITDVFQFIVFMVGIPLMAYIAVEAAGGVQHIWATLPKSNLQVFGHKKFASYLPLFIIWSFLPVAVSSPLVVQRMLMAQYPQQLRDQFLVVGVFLSLFRWILLFIGCAAVVLFPHVAPGNAVAHVINDLLPTGVKGMAIAALVSVSMSSLDSLLHTAGITVVHDVIKPVCDIKKVEINELRWVRWATVLLSGLVIFVALYAQGALQLFLMALAFQIPTLLCPLLAGIMGLQVDKRDFYAALAGTVLAFVATKLYLPTTYSHFTLPMLIVANVCIFMGMHLMKNKGFVVRKPQQEAYMLWRPMRAHIFAGLTWHNLFTSPRRIIAYSQAKAQKYGAPYVLLGIFVAMIYTVPYFLWSYKPLPHQSTMLILRFIGATLCALLIVKDKWPQSLLPYLPTYWHLTLLYCLPFTSTVMFLLTQGSVEWLINVALTIMFLIVLVDWMSFIILTVLGVALGLLFYQIAIGPIDLQLDFSTGYLLVYTCVFSTVIALLFSSRKEQHLAAKLREISDHYYSINQIKTDTTPAVMRIAAMIDQQIQETIAKYSLSIHAASNVQQEDTSHAVTTDWLHYFFPTALAVIQQGDQMIEQLVAELKTSYIAPQGSRLSLKACVNAALEAYCMRHPQSIHLDLLEDYMIDTSFNHLQYAIIHVLRFLHAHHLGDEVCLRTTRQQGIHMRLSGRALPPALLHDLCTLFPAKETAKHPGLAISKLLIEAHGGHLLYATGSQPQNVYTEFIIFLPPAEEKPRTGVEIV